MIAGHALFHLHIFLSLAHSVDCCIIVTASDTDVMLCVVSSQGDLSRRGAGIRLAGVRYVERVTSGKSDLMLQAATNANMELTWILL